MKVSIVTVTYNSAATIEEALNSVDLQSYENIEHIVVDGGSTDETVQLVKRHSRRLSQLISEPDNGIYDAMNKGLRLATGEIVGFLNGDDMLASKDAIQFIVQAASDDGAKAFFGDLLYIDPSRQNPLVRYWRAGTFSRQKLRSGWMPPHPTLYVKRSMMEDLGGFDASLKIAADYEFMLRLFSTPKLRAIYIHQVLVKMRVGGISNASLRTVILKSREDLSALRKHRIGGLPTLFCKNLRKLPQFFARPAG